MPTRATPGPSADQAEEDREDEIRERAVGLMAGGVCFDMDSAVAIARTQTEAEEKERAKARQEQGRPRHHPRAKPRRDRTVIV